MFSKFEEWTQILDKKKDFKLLPGFLSFFYEKDVVSSGYFSYVATWNVLTLIYWPN